MFTGLIEELGRVESFLPQGEGGRLKISARTVLTDATLGASIAVNGVCLTALEITPESFVADLAPETVRRTSLGGLAAGSPVNLERPLLPHTRLGGHIVQGHVDGTGEIVAIEQLGNENWWLKIAVPAELDRYLVFKGSVAVDGISLTVASMENQILGITVIPHTFAHTNIGSAKVGQRVNLECDILAKYVEKLLPIRG